VVGLKVKVGDAVAVLQAAAEAFIVAAGALVLPLAPRVAAAAVLLVLLLSSRAPRPGSAAAAFLGLRLECLHWRWGTVNDLDVVD